MKSLAKIFEGEIEIYKDSTDISTLMAVIDGDVETISRFECCGGVEEWEIGIDNLTVADIYVDLIQKGD